MIDLKLDVVFNENEYIQNVNNSLWDLVENYKKQTLSTGCDPADYATLYKNIRKYKFKEVLECGTGVSTIVISQALYENFLETGVKGRVTSMESKRKYFDIANNLLVGDLRDHVDIVLSEIESDYYGPFRGFKYKNKPHRQYDLCWIDGPEFEIPSNKGGFAFNFDFIDVVNESESKVYGLIDGRCSTTFVLQSIFGKEMVRYFGYNKLVDGFGLYPGWLGVIDGVDKKMLEEVGSGSNFYIKKIE